MRRKSSMLSSLSGICVMSSGKAVVARFLVKDLHLFSKQSSLCTLSCVCVEIGLNILFDAAMLRHGFVVGFSVLACMLLVGICALLTYSYHSRGAPHWSSPVDDVRSSRWIIVSSCLTEQITRHVRWSDRFIRMFDKIFCLSHSS